MRAVIVICFVISAVSSLPIKVRTGEPDLPLLKTPELTFPDSKESDVRENPDYPELPVEPQPPEDGVGGSEPDLPIETPTLTELPENITENNPDILSTTELPSQPYSSKENEIIPGSPDYTPTEMPEDITENNPDMLNTTELPSQPDSSEEDEIIPGSPDDIPIMNKTMRNQIRPGMLVTSYNVELTPDIASGTFSGLVVANVVITDANTLEDEIVFNVRDLNINSVQFSIAGGSAINNADFNVDEDDGILEIDTGFEISLYTFFIEYTGSLSNFGNGLWVGEFDNSGYMAMNLHATNARRVFPCLDELTEPTTISFTFNNIQYNNIIMNSALEDNTVGQFKALQGPPLLWGMVAHSFSNINNPTPGVQLFARPGLFNQENQASVAINFYFNNLQEWTQKPYDEIVLDQDGRMVVLAIPDVHKDWYALSTVCIWEPYMMMEWTHSVKQRKEALTEIAQAVSRQWFGYVIYPENWRHQWAIQGLASYTAYELNREFQSSQLQDITLLDFITIFVTDVVQEALYRDAYRVAPPLQPADDIFDEEDIRIHIKGLDVLKYKSPAFLNMLRLMLGNADQDFIRNAGQILVNSRALEGVNSRFFIDAINSEWLSTGNGIVDDLPEFLEPWLQNNGYPTLHVGLRQGGVLLTQEKFGYTATPQINYDIPITWTTNIAPNFGEDNIRPAEMMGSTMTINVPLGDEDFVLFNIQGQGYYRVNYDSALWERIIEALNDPDQREQIHPLNRATLVDDALNLARAGMLDYDTAFQVVLTMEHEIDYAPWKAFVRNMNFLRKRLVAFVDDDEDMDPDIYLRMVRRTVGRVESEIGFYPDPLVTEDSSVSLTRGLVMDHACRAGYMPCIAAAVDWFWDPDNRDVVNPNIPHEIRPAVYCTMVREGGNDIVNALYERLEIEPTMYERVVILESLGCSQDQGFILTLLQETLATNGPYTVEERNRIFKAVAEGNYANAFTAVNFMSQRTADIRRMYGGAEKLEDLIWHLGENMADDALSGDFQIWTNAINSNLDDSELAAGLVRQLVEENLNWDDVHRDYVYEWIDENHAPTLVVSLVLIFGSFLLTILNH